MPLACQGLCAAPPATDWTIAPRRQRAAPARCEKSDAMVNDRSPIRHPRIPSRNRGAAQTFRFVMRVPDGVERNRRPKRLQPRSRIFRVVRRAALKEPIRQAARREKHVTAARHKDDRDLIQPGRAKGPFNGLRRLSVWTQLLPPVSRGAGTHAVNTLLTNCDRKPYFLVPLPLMCQKVGLRARV
jgi:hypothetical protein